MKLEPFKNRVIVKLSEQETKTAGGIIIPEAARKRPLTGTVIEVSNEVENLYAGDTVLMMNGAGRELEYNGDKCLLVTDEEILCKFIYE